MTAANKLREDFYSILKDVPMSYEDFCRIAIAATNWANAEIDALADVASVNPKYRVTATAEQRDNVTLIEPVKAA